MIVQSFKSVLWVGAVAGAALSCYMVSLRVASERAALERVETRILLAKRDIRALDTELVTRGRVRQLERWNTDVLALAPPTEEQFLHGEVQLASLTRVDPAPVVMAAADEADAVVAKRPGVVLASFAPESAADRPQLVRASAPRRDLDDEPAPKKAADEKASAKAADKKTADRKVADKKVAAKTSAAKTAIASKKVQVKKPL